MWRAWFYGILAMALGDSLCVHRIPRISEHGAWGRTAWHDMPARVSTFYLRSRKVAMGRIVSDLQTRSSMRNIDACSVFLADERRHIVCSVLSDSEHDQTYSGLRTISPLPCPTAHARDTKGLGGSTTGGIWDAIVGCICAPRPPKSPQQSHADAAIKFKFSGSCCCSTLCRSLVLAASSDHRHSRMWCNPPQGCILELRHSDPPIPVLNSLIRCLPILVFEAIPAVASIVPLGRIGG